MFKLAIVDDEKEARETLNDMIGRYARENGEEISVALFSRAVDFLDDCTRYDLVFLDIRMPDYDGVETARRLRKRDESTTLVFVTDMANLAIKGYEVNAADFIVKPLEYFSFYLKMNRVFACLKRNAGKELMFSTQDGIMKLPVAAVRYIEVFAHTLVYHTEDGDYRGYGSLVRAENDLSGMGFARCNNSYLVNLKYVRRMEGLNCYLAGKEEVCLPVSHAKKKAFLQALNDYMGQGK